MNESPYWSLDQAVREPPRGVLARLAAGMWRQTSRSRICPPTLRLDGQLALVTGGNAGIGLGICRGLLRRGADVVLLSRNESKAAEACARLRAESEAWGDASGTVDAVRVDLGDLAAVREGARRLASQLRDRRADLLVCNAGVWPLRHSTSSQGHELAFATNVLGHFALLRHTLATTLTDAARIVMLTGDIYVLAGDCGPDYPYQTPLGGMLAYCRSKLGNLWLAQQLQERHPQLHVVSVHPGVVASGLGGTGGALGTWIRRRTLIDADRGAQSSLYAAVEPRVPRGSYLHNTFGRVDLARADAARDSARAARLWAQCESLCEGFD
ncbi:MAG: SDR family NAD(P)-dependent oxidoreductase [Proteobacteria bacterium]|nr:SDR family NAD(P)-dependent oxidoreductase [Pseudomonadota bacterium]